MEQLDNTWIFQNRKECETREKTPATLGLKNMAGVFILVLAGIAGGCALIIVEIVYKRHKIRSQRKLALAKNAADRWRGAVEVGDGRRAASLTTHAFYRYLDVTLDNVASCRI